ncbi:MAG: hypothetical protein ACXVPU_00565 [Bacteroidia bacterium]
MRIKKIIFDSLIAIVFLSGCNNERKTTDNKATITFEEYYPLKNMKGEEFYVSHITKTGTISDKNDSLICKSVLVKGKEIFYFDNNTKSGDTTIIGCLTFCNGAFYFDKGNFYYSPVFWKYDLKKANLDYFEVLFPNDLKLDTIYKYKDGEEIRKYKFIGFESIKIKDKIFPDCLKLTVTQDWITSQYTDTVWFQKGRGVVKWFRGTGRLEEIK